MAASHGQLWQGPTLIAPRGSSQGLLRGCSICQHNCIRSECKNCRGVSFCPLQTKNECFLGAQYFVGICGGYAGRCWCPRSLAPIPLSLMRADARAPRSGARTRARFFARSL